MFMSRRRFPWLDITAQRSDENEEDILADGAADSKVRSKIGKMSLSQQGDDGFA